MTRPLILDEEVRVENLAHVVIHRRHAHQRRICINTLCTKLSQVGYLQAVLVCARSLPQQPLQQCVIRLHQFDQLQAGGNVQRMADDVETDQADRRRQQSVHHRADDLRQYHYQVRRSLGL